MDKEVVKELIQNQLNTENLVDELQKILEGQKRDKMLQDYELLREKLGGKGASDHAAEIIVNYDEKNIIAQLAEIENLKQFSIKMLLKFRKRVLVGI